MEKEKARILLKLEEMNRYVTELMDILPDKKEYHQNLMKKRACEKTIEIAIESLIDIAAMVVSVKRWGLPTDEDDLFTILRKKNVIDVSLLNKLRRMKGFRNMLVHRYGDIDDELVFGYITNNITDFEDFKEKIRDFIKNW